jgi:glucokinase
VIVVSRPGAADRPDVTRSRPALAFAGLDIGGTKIAAALIDEAGRPTVFETVPTPLGAAAVLSAADDLIDLLAGEAADRDLTLTSIGVGVAELVDLGGAIVSEAVIPGLANEDLVGRWSSQRRVVVESDVRAAALAEARLGAGRGHSSFAYISVGTGISYCLVIDGEPWTGSGGGAILLGSAVMAECAGAPWVLEEIASGTALLAYYHELGGELPTVVDVLRTPDLDRPVAAAAAAAIGRAARALGIGISVVVNLLDPAAVVVGGGLGSATGPYWDQALQSAREHTYQDRARDTPIVQAHLGARAGAIGAALVGARADVR